MKVRLVLAILLPFLTLALQWLLWPWITPFVWFLFFPAVFFSARLGGLWGGLTSTVLSAGMVWFFFIPPQLSWAMDNPANLYSVGMFLGMGYLFSDTQERLRRAQRSTEVALAESNAAKEKITQLYQKTLELDELKNQFFANVSHELRTPLTLIMGPLTRRLEKSEKSEAERREDEMMLRNARLLYRHVSDLLDAAKLEAGRMTIDYARLDLGGLMRVTGAQFSSLAEERGIEYTIEVPSIFEVAGDGEKIQRVLLNLLSNAFKFTPDGGRVGLYLREEAGQAVIEVPVCRPTCGRRCSSVFARSRAGSSGVTAARVLVWPLSRNLPNCTAAVWAWTKCLAAAPHLSFGCPWLPRLVCSSRTCPAISIRSSIFRSLMNCTPPLAPLNLRSLFRRGAMRRWS
jgi:signal transduction histidine kinase